MPHRGPNLWILRLRPGRKGDRTYGGCAVQRNRQEKAPCQGQTRTRLGNVTINGRQMADYLGRRVLELVDTRSLLTNNEGKYDILVKVNGGGTTGQAGAVRHGIARALCSVRTRN